MTLTEFRKDKPAVEALHAFIHSEHGFKFLQMLETESVLTALSSTHNNRPEAIRPLALAEQGSAESLLGRIVGQTAQIKTIKEAAMPYEDAKPNVPDTQRAEVAKKMFRK